MMKLTSNQRILSFLVVGNFGSLHLSTEAINSGPVESHIDLILMIIVPVSTAFLVPILKGRKAKVVGIVFIVLLFFPCAINLYWWYLIAFFMHP